ncbi:hypothetical protein H6P81_006769 [Aristolochia fimbriata]|uniref:acetyl-CoA carboxytransferase n=1 Tax=Aristolochia fimbriata TaxID=158543 RepID=A0AAV7F0F1_ARIFI|nr:hypothetical protein H6P81_006769 [Aristolochia fimbriata]
MSSMMTKGYEASHAHCHTEFVKGTSITSQKTVEGQSFARYHHFFRNLHLVAWGMGFNCGGIIWPDFQHDIFLRKSGDEEQLNRCADFCMLSFSNTSVAYRLRESRIRSLSPHLERSAEALANLHSPAPKLKRYSIEGNNQRGFKRKETSSNSSARPAKERQMQFSMRQAISIRNSCRTNVKECELGSLDTLEVWNSFENLTLTSFFSSPSPFAIPDPDSDLRRGVLGEIFEQVRCFLLSGEFTDGAKMASLPHPSTAFSSTSASDLLRSSCNGVNGLPLKTLGRAQIGARRADFTIAAKLKKWKKHEYPWPNEIDPDVKGGYLSYLSHFKPLKDKPKPVTLDFEKPLRDLERKIIDVRKMADETGLDFSDQIISLETKYQKALKDLYTHLTPIQRLSIARHPNRPTFLDHVLNITDKWVELHGDRAGYDDPAMVTGIGSIDGRSYMFIGHQKGRNTKENIARNFGMPTPHGYRKALRMMYYADHHGLPIITFIDTPGAFADLRSEELGQGEAIAHNLRTMYGLKVPIVTVVIGEGGSGGALAIGCANKLLMLENAVFFVASPEACAAILWKSSKAAPKAAEKLRITATELCKLKIADGVIPEPLGGAHTDAKWTSQQIKKAVVGSMNELLEMDTPQLLRHRMLKFRRLGGFQEGIPQEPVKKVNMKKKDEPIIAKEKISNTSDQGADEIGKLKRQTVKSKKAPSPRRRLNLDGMIKKLKKEAVLEFAAALKSMGLLDKFETLQKEVIESRKSGVVDSALKDKIDKLKEEFDQGLSEVPNFSRMSRKRDMLKELTKSKKLSEQKNKAVSLKQEINKRLKEVMDRSDIQQKIEVLRSELSNGGVSSAGDLDVQLKEKITQVKKEVGSELVNVLRSLQLDLQNVKSRGESASDLRGEPSLNEIKNRIDGLNKEVAEKMKDAVNSSNVKDKIELLKKEVARAGRSPDPATKNKIEELKQQIKESLVDAVSVPALVDKHEQLKNEIAKATGEDERLSQDSVAVGEGAAKPDVTRVEMNVGATRERA